MMAQHHYSFPVVTGINAQDSLASRRARMGVYQRFLAELDQNNQHLTAQVSEIDLSDPEDLRAVMPEQGSDILAHFGEDHFLQRLQLYKAHIAEWRGRYPSLIGVDLRYNGEVPLEMSKDSPGGKDTVVPTEEKPAAEKKPITKAEAKPAAAIVSAKPAAAKAAPAKAAPEKTTAAEHKATEAKKKAAKLKAEKAKAAHAKPAAHKLHPTPAATKQGA